VIFVTVGSSEPFDRLVRAVDEWARLRGRRDVFAQIGRSDYRPKHIEAVQFLSLSEFQVRVHSAKVIVAHAGMGSIITALDIGRPIVIMPRRAHLGETRSDHQLATARQFDQQRRLIVAFDERELFPKLDQAETSPVPSQIKAEALPHLIATIRTFIHAGATKPPRTREKELGLGFLRSLWTFHTGGVCRSRAPLISGEQEHPKAGQQFRAK